MTLIFANVLLFTYNLHLMYEKHWDMLMDLGCDGLWCPPVIYHQHVHRHVNGIHSQEKTLTLAEMSDGMQPGEHIVVFSPTPPTDDFPQKSNRGGSPQNWEIW
jgi:hypothetical protein